jgi:hypothetical protein
VGQSGVMFVKVTGISIIIHVRMQRQREGGEERLLDVPLCNKKGGGGIVFWFCDVDLGCTCFCDILTYNMLLCIYFKHGWMDGCCHHKHGILRIYVMMSL